MVKEGLPDNPLEVIAGKLLAMAGSPTITFSYAPDPDKFFQQVDKVKAEHPDNLCAKYLEKVRQVVYDSTAHH
jgi:hypothetical protein